MKIFENANIITLDNITDEDRELLISKKTLDPTRDNHCPQCGGDVLEENYGYEKLIFCTRCEYSKTKTIRHD